MKTTEQRFWEKVDKRGSDECWNWTASCIGKAGYPQFQWDGKNGYAHKYSYWLHFGGSQDGLWVGTRCNNHRCVNPSHLFLGSAREVCLKPTSVSVSNLRFRAVFCHNGHRRQESCVEIKGRGGAIWRHCALCFQQKQKRNVLRRFRNGKYESSGQLKRCATCGGQFFDKGCRSQQFCSSRCFGKHNEPHLQRDKRGRWRVIA